MAEVKLKLTASKTNTGGEMGVLKVMLDVESWGCNGEEEIFGERIGLLTCSMRDEVRSDRRRRSDAEQLEFEFITEIEMEMEM